MAAHIEERGVSVLNQTGLAQKFGAVTGHVRIAARQKDIHSVRIPSGEAQLVLGADLVRVLRGDGEEPEERDPVLRHGIVFPLMVWFILRPIMNIRTSVSVKYTAIESKKVGIDI